MPADGSAHAFAHHVAHALRLRGPWRAGPGVPPWHTPYAKRGAVRYPSAGAGLMKVISQRSTLRVDGTMTGVLGVRCPCPSCLLRLSEDSVSDSQSDYGYGGGGFS